MALDGGTCRIYPVRCKRWKCVRCNPIKVREAQRRLAAGYEPGSTWFLTLTLPGGTDPEQSFDLVTAAFKRFRQRVQRRYGRREWASVVEVQQRGVAHLHVLMRGTVMGPGSLRALAVASGFGRSVVVRRASAAHVPYMVKALHLTATVGLPAFTRRITSSHAWAERLRRPRLAPASQWWIANAPPEQTADFLQALGLSITVLVPDRSVRRPRWLRIRWWPAGAFSPARASLPYPVQVSA